MIARKSLLILATNGLGAAIGAVSTFFIGRYMDPAAFGMFGFAMGTIGLMSFVADMGFNTAHVKRVSEGADLGDSLTTFMVLKMGLIALFGVVAASAIFLWEGTFGFHDAVTIPVLLVVLALFVLQELRAIPAQTFIALTRTAKTQSAVLAENLVKFPLIVLSALVFGHLSNRWVPLGGVAEAVAGLIGLAQVTAETGALLIAIAWATGMGVSALYAYGILVRHRYPFGSFDLALAKRYAAFALPIAILSALLVINVRVDSIMVGFFWAAEDVGHYFMMQRISTILVILPIAVNTIFFPTVNDLAARDQHVEAADKAKEVTRLMSMTILAPVAMIVVLPRETIHIFLSDAYLPAAPILVTFALYTYALSLATVPGGMLMAYDKSRNIALRGGILVGSNILFNVLLIPDSLLGIPLPGLRGLGAALGTLGAQILAVIVATFWTYHLTRSLPFGRSVLIHPVAAGAAALTVHMLAPLPFFGGVDRIWELAGIVLVGLSVYGALLLAFREIRRQEVRLVMDLFDPRKMFRYVRDELKSERAEEKRD